MTQRYGRNRPGFARGEQYPPGTTQGDRPDEIIDPHGDRWVWVDADKRGVPGYRWVGGESFSRLSGTGEGPAHTRDYVQQGRMCAYYGPGCPKHDHNVPAVETARAITRQETR